jgi:hypothetical protein
MLSLCKCYAPLHPTQNACSALCSPPAISHSLYTHVAGNDNDAVTFSIEATEVSFLADRRLHLFA